MAIPGPAPASDRGTSPARAPKPLWAYTVHAASSAGQTAFFAVGEDIVDACRRALQGLEARTDGPWRIDRVEVLGEALG